MSSIDDPSTMSMHERKESLSAMLQDRPLKDSLYEWGLAADDEVLAASLQPRAFELQQRLSVRLEKDDLIMRGIMPMDFVEEPEVSETFALEEELPGKKEVVESPPESMVLFCFFFFGNIIFSVSFYGL